MNKVEHEVRYDSPDAVGNWCPTVRKRGRWLSSKKVWKLVFRGALQAYPNALVLYVSGCSTASKLFSGSVWIMVGDYHGNYPTDDLRYRSIWTPNSDHLARLIETLSKMG